MPRFQINPIGIDEYSWLIDDFDCRSSLEVEGGIIAVGHHASIGEVVFGWINSEAFVIEIERPKPSKSAA